MAPYDKYPRERALAEAISEKFFECSCGYYERSPNYRQHAGDCAAGHYGYDLVEAIMGLVDEAAAPLQARIDAVRDQSLSDEAVMRAYVELDQQCHTLHRLERIEMVREMIRVAIGDGSLTAWQPIATAPKDGTAVLITCAGIGMLVRIGHFVPPDHRGQNEPNSPDWWVVHGELIEEDHRPGMRPTLWMPLPVAPAGATETTQHSEQYFIVSVQADHAEERWLALTSHGRAALYRPKADAGRFTRDEIEQLDLAKWSEGIRWCHIKPGSMRVFEVTETSTRSERPVDFAGPSEEQGS